MTENCRNCCGWTRYEGDGKHCTQCDGTGLESVRAAVEERRREEKL